MSFARNNGGFESDSVDGLFRVVVNIHDFVVEQISSCEFNAVWLVDAIRIYKKFLHSLAGERLWTRQKFSRQ